jgi:hypothetical protein
MPQVRIEGYEEYNRCGNEYLSDSEVELTFIDSDDSVEVILEGYVAREDAKITIKKKDLIRALKFITGE